MLALARGEGQSIIIDGTIEVKVVKWTRSAVRLAIQAPRAVTVDREEIWRRMHPGQATPLEKAEQDRAARLAEQGGQGGQGGSTPSQGPAAPPGSPSAGPGASASEAQPPTEPPAA